MKRLLFSVTAADCEWQDMTAGGKGGQHQNRKKTAIRCIHRPSGAVGESREHRSQILNKRAAFERMAKTDKFQRWIKVKASIMMGHKSPEEIVEEMMQERNLKVEYQTSEGWKESKSIKE